MLDFILRDCIVVISTEHESNFQNIKTNKVLLIRVRSFITEYSVIKNNKFLQNVYTALRYSLNTSST